MTGAAYIKHACYSVVRRLYSQAANGAKQRIALVRETVADMFHAAS